ncbi:hypothetical protein ACFE04_003987 [Oxalis oulophora]
MMLKRGKLAGKSAINNLLHHHTHHVTAATLVGVRREYEFSCSNTPNYTFHSFKRRHNLFACTHAPPTKDDDVATMNAVKVVLEMLNNNVNNEVVLETAYNSPVLPGFGFGRSPAVRQLRITDSPFPVREFDDGDNGLVDKAAEAFINKFYKDLKNQKHVHGY